MTIKQHIWLAVICIKALDYIIPYFISLIRENKEFKRNLLNSQKTLKEDNVHLANMIKKD